jgi:hypothetical protein
VPVSLAWTPVEASADGHGFLADHPVASASSSKITVPTPAC